MITIKISMKRWVLAALCIVVLSLIVALGQIKTTTAQTSTACPPTATPAEPREVGASQQKFDYGIMVWIQDTGSIYVMLDPSRTYKGGTVEVYQDSWKDGLPDTNPSLTPPAGRAQPNRGFGYLWQNNQHVRDELGWPVDSEEGGYTALVVTQGDTTWFNGPAHNTYKITGTTWQEVDVYRKQ